MDALGVIALILAIVGVLGGIVPMLPGPPLSWAGLLCVYLSDSAKDQVPTSALIIWLVLATVITIMDYLIPGMLTKVTGGHKAAEWGATIGLFAGVFLIPVGMILGSLIGAFIGELMVAKQDVGSSVKAALGAFLGFILTTGIKVIFSVILLWRVIVYLF